MSRAALPPDPAGPPDLPSLAAVVRGGNPFLDNRVHGTAALAADVPAVHEAAEWHVTALAHEALTARRGVGAMLWGEAGVGKSHLLARLAAWAAGGAAVYVTLHNLQAAPEYLPRSLLRGVVSVLARGRTERLLGTPLFDLARAGVEQAVGGQLKWYSWAELRRAHTAWLDGLAALGPSVDRAVHDVLFELFRATVLRARGENDSSQAALAVRWLSGDALDTDEARVLGLRPPRTGELVGLTDAQEARLAVTALTRLAACRGLPFVLALDQVDNLDADQFGALSRFLEGLLDAAPNLLVLTAGVQASLIGWREKGVVQESAWHRIAQFEVQLQRVSVDQARAIVQARLDVVLARFAGIPEVGALRSADPLFPLGRVWDETTFAGKVEVRPRDALNWAREAWRQEQEEVERQGAEGWLATWAARRRQPPPPPPLPPPEVRIHQAIDAAVEAAVRASVARRRAEPHGLPPDADHLAGLLFALLRQCQQAEPGFGLVSVARVPAPRVHVRPRYDLDIVCRAPDGGETHTGVVVVTALNALAVTAALRRLLEDARPDSSLRTGVPEYLHTRPPLWSRLVLVTDARVGLPLGPRGREYLAELRNQGPDRFVHREVSFDELATLDALQAVEGLARSGDLSVDGVWRDSVTPRRSELVEADLDGTARPVTPAEVIASHRRQGRYLASGLLALLLSPAANG